MKNKIEYFYDFHVDSLINDSSRYMVYAGEHKYIFKICDNLERIDNLRMVGNVAGKDNCYFNIVLNKFGEHVTIIDGCPYILLLVDGINNRPIELFDVGRECVESKYCFDCNHSFPWISLWENKIDFLELWLVERKKISVDDISQINYYVGLSENALQYLKDAINENAPDSTDTLTYQHYRLNAKSTIFDYFDPTNLVVDHKSRDVGEYIKSVLFDDDFDCERVDIYLKKHVFSRYGLGVLYARLLFPTFFFDRIENAVKLENAFDLGCIECNFASYENNLKELSVFLKGEYGLPVIDWLLK